MELRHLRYFRAVGRAEHFGRAAMDLRVAQPALTRQIRDLEAELGVDLFERLPRGVRLSEAGRVFLSDVEEILAQVDRAADRARLLGSGHLGTIRVGLSEIIAQHAFISRGLLHFRDSEPGVALDLRSMGSLAQIEAVREGTLDAGIVYDFHLDERDGELLDRAVLGMGETMLAVHRNHHFANRASVAMKELIDEPALWPERRVAPAYFDRLMAACLERGSPPRILQECTTNSILLSLVSVGMGIGFVTATPDVGPASNIVLVPIEDLGLTFQVVLVWRRRDPSAALGRFAGAMAAGESSQGR